jgi:2-oxoglutarate dehydrogenase E2 component (dihydrolipoamide succinyltransferase)
MSTDVIMPQMGESIAEGTIVKWLKQVGDKVARDEPLFEISTDKVDAEIPAPAAGVLLEIKIGEGQTVAINTVVAVIGDAGAAPVVAPAAAQPSAVPAASVPAAEQPVAAPPAPRADASADELRKTRSSPLVRKIAAEHGIDLRNVPGSGISGRVTKEDILAYVAAGAPPPPAPAPVVTAAPAPAPIPPAAAQVAAPPPPATHAAAFKPGERVRVEPMSIMRRKIAEHMVASRRTSAHVNTVFEMDCTRMVEVRNQLKHQFEERDGVKLTYTPMIAKAVVDALKAYPILNASIDGDNVVYKQDINIGIAVALEWGLIVPVVKHADELSLLGLTRAINDLAERARSKRLKPDEVQDGTFTITNPGIYGGMFGTPIINQPQVAILGVGAIEKRPVVINDAIAIRTMSYFSLSFDHRLIDGAVADQFMAHLKQALASGSFAI